LSHRSLLILALVLWPLCAEAQPTVVQANGSGLGVSTATLSSPVTTGNRIVFELNTWTGCSVYGTPTDTEGNTYTFIGSIVRAGAAQSQLAAWTAYPVIGGSSFAITANCSSGGFSFQIVMAREIDCSSGCDYNSDYASATQASSTAPAVTTTTPPAPNSLALASTSGTCAPTPGATWSTVTNENWNSSGVYIGGQHKVVSGTYSADWTSSSCDHWVHTYSFAAAGGGGVGGRGLFRFSLIR
jgi:hypothetical protein